MGSRGFVGALLLLSFCFTLQSFEGPAKLIFPVRLDPWQQSILGLGDIVVPGVFISMCLRFDHWLATGHSSSHEEPAVAPDVKKTSPRPAAASNIDIHQVGPAGRTSQVTTSFLPVVGRICNSVLARTDTIYLSFQGRAVRVTSLPSTGTCTRPQDLHADV